MLAKQIIAFATKLYDESSLESLLTISNREKRREAIPAAIHKKLEGKLHDSSDPLFGYYHVIE
ncbi:hypothetical protein [Aquimarina sp. RZ0]|uniref:hypothetical protein n=1 Tax=Aquimarina sp. RZ0 TaxID=2607730 RepID=UPI0011F34E32|nr:hypothetical protein [Aquimarina sp. RZ0]KAA1242140.1 hypothetical protein F0000_26145 [Aquimarina sp. RZ0]